MPPTCRDAPYARAMSDSVTASASPSSAADGIERWCTSSALVLAGVTALIAGPLIGRGDAGIDPWRAVIVLWAVAPSFVAWTVVFYGRLVAARMPVLWFALFPAAAAALLSYLVLAPSLVLLLIAAVRASSGGLPTDVRRAIRAIAGGVLFVAGWGAGFLALFAAADERCRETASSFSCSSDVVTLPEAAIAVALLGAGVAAAIALARAR